jgi:Spy/CpxP family protein refolding chaperone
MNIRFGAFIAMAAFVTACDNSSTSPRVDESAVLLFDQAATMDSVSLVPRGPIYDRTVPDSVKLTAAQQAAIKALHDAYAAKHKAQFDQLKAIHEEARAAFKANKTRDEIKAILDKGKPIMEAMRADFDALRAAVGAILTPAQKAWAAAHQRMGPGPMGGPMPGRP